MTKLGILLPLLFSIYAFGQSGPENLSFAGGIAPGDVHAGWYVPDFLRQKGLAAEVRKDGCRIGKQCAVVPGGQAGNLVQGFDATPYRGKMISFRAWIRLDSTNPNDTARLWLETTRENHQIGFSDDMRDRPITSPEWKLYEISGLVDSDAQYIVIGLLSFGGGRAWIDGIQFEVVESAAYSQIAEAYKVVDAVYQSGKLDDLRSIATPDAQYVSSTVTRSLFKLPGPAFKLIGHSSITAMKISGDQAEVSVNVVFPSVTSGQKIGGAVTNRDTWTRTSAGWKLQRTELLNIRQWAAPTEGEVARPVIAELKQRAVKLNTVEAGAPNEDLSAFGKAVGDARIVALGEASHGTREFFQMKHRLLEYLVKEKGFTVFAIEGNWPESLAVDRYIKTGEGDPKSALAGMYFWTWQTEEVLAMIEWMRNYNRAPGNHPILTFTSFDMQQSSVAGKRVLEFLKQVSPGDVPQAESVYKSAYEMLSHSKPNDPEAKAIAVKAHAIAQMLYERREAMIKASSPSAWRDARQAATIVYQACTERSGTDGAGYRDEMMAWNVQWLATEVHPDEKIVLWAHNGHVSFSADGHKNMGAWLREWYGKRVYIVGFDFRRGHLRAVEMSAGKPGGVQEHVVPPSPEGTGDAILSAAELPIFFLDLTSLPSHSALADWMQEPHLFYQAGAGWHSDYPVSDLRVEVRGKQFDGLIFVEEGHAARALPRISQ